MQQAYAWHADELEQARAREVAQPVVVVPQVAQPVGVVPQVALQHRPEPAVRQGEQPEEESAQAEERAWEPLQSVGEPKVVPGQKEAAAGQQAAILLAWRQRRARRVYLFAL